MLQARLTMITIITTAVGSWTVWAAVLSSESCRIVVPVQGIIGNSVPTSPKGKVTLLEWKRRVATAAERARRGNRLDPRQTYSISAGFSFHRPTHGHQDLDVENFLKPTFDGLAAGLFCEPGTDCATLERFAYDDSGFRFLFAHRLPDARSPLEEGVGLVVSQQEQN